MGVSGQRHALAALHPRERTPGTRWTGGWVGLRAGLDTEARGKIFCLYRGSNPDRPVCNDTMLTEQGRDADHSPHLMPKSRMSRSYTPLRLRAAWRVRDSFTFLILLYSHLKG
jgi:hypothetical protein